MKKVVISMFLILGISSILFTKKIFSNEESEKIEHIKIITEQILENTDNDIDVKYPQLSGLKDNRDEIVNDLIKNEICSSVEAKKNGMTSHNLYLLLEYEIKYLSNDFISISYSGIWIPTGNGIGFRGGDELYTINIGAVVYFW